MGATKSKVKGLSEGRIDSYTWLYASFFNALCVYATRFGLENGEAEDIVQELFCRIYNGKQSFENETALKSYLYISIRNLSLKFLQQEERRKSREGHFLSLQENESTFLDDIIQQDVYRQMSLLLQELPPQCKIIFERALEGATSEEIARELSLSVETVKTQRKKAKRILREKYALLYKLYSVLL